MKIAHIRDLRGIGHRSGIGGKKPLHLRGGFHIKLIGFKTDGASVGDHVVGLDAHQDRLGFRIPATQVMDIIGGYQRNACFFRYFKDCTVDRLLLFQAVILYFQIKMILAKDIPHFAGVLFCHLVLAADDMPGNVSCQAGG